MPFRDEKHYMLFIQQAVPQADIAEGFHKGRKTMAQLTQIINAEVISDGKVHPHCRVTMDARQILAVESMDSPAALAVDSTIDAAGQYLCPAYIDLHTHGAYRHDVMEATTEALDAVCRFQFENGVGTFLPTALTAPLPTVQRLADLLREYTPPVPVDLPGIHMEGPFLSPVNRGAQPEEYLLSPTDDAMAFLKKNKQMLRLITVSPDVKGIVPLITWCVQNNIVVSGGHDAAIDDEVEAAIAAGMTGVTHIFCCSSGISRRDGSPTKHLGITELGLLRDELYTEAIADNCHLPPQLLRLLYKAKGHRGICMVSDSISAAGMPPGDYLLGDRSTGVGVTVTGEVALLKDRSLFAGSITPLGRMVPNAVQAGIPLAHAVAMATATPARVLKLHGKGSIAKGFAARLNLLDKNGRLLAVIANGNCHTTNK